MPKEYKANLTEVKVGQHIQKLMKRLRYMETHKKVKPHFSQGCDRLLQRIDMLMTGDDHRAQSIDEQPEQDTYAYWNQLRSNQTI